MYTHTFTTKQQKKTGDESSGTNNASSGKVPKAIIPSNIKTISSNADYNVMSIDPIEMARQCTMLEYEWYSKIKPTETYGLSWNVKEKQHLAPNILGMIKRSNEVAIWVCVYVCICEKSSEKISTLYNCRTKHYALK